MQNFQGSSRYQLKMSSLEDKISATNKICFTEALFNSIDIVKRAFHS